MKTKFPPEVDPIIRNYYPRYGGSRTVQELFKKGIYLHAHQVQSRARVLHLNAPLSGANRRQLYKAGDRVAVYRIKEFLGEKKTDDLFLGALRYRVQCVVCGNEEEKTQNGLYQAEQRDTPRCSACAKRERYERELEELEENERIAAELVQMYQWFMFTMPKVPIKYLTHSKRIDSQRAIM